MGREGIEHLLKCEYIAVPLLNVGKRFHQLFEKVHTMQKGVLPYQCFQLAPTLESHAVMSLEKCTSPSGIHRQARSSSEQSRKRAVSTGGISSAGWQSPKFQMLLTSWE